MSSDRKHKHKTSPHGTGHQQRGQAKASAPKDDPPRPPDLQHHPLSQDPIYGAEFQYKWSLGERIYHNHNSDDAQYDITILDHKWEQKYITKILVDEIPILKSRPLRFHCRIALQFRAFFRAVALRGDAGMILNSSGTFLPRTLTGHPSRLSNHALGTAIDINDDDLKHHQYFHNHRGDPGARRGRKGSVRELADICSDFGIYWGGWYTVKKDCAHFEAVRVISPDALRVVCKQYGIYFTELYPDSSDRGDWPPPPENERIG